MHRKKRGKMEKNRETLYITKRIKKYEKLSIKKKSRFTVR